MQAQDDARPGADSEAAGADLLQEDAPSPILRQASVQTSDRLVMLLGRCVGERDGCVIVDLTDEQYAELRAALAQPNGGVLMAEDGTLTVRDPEPEVAIPTFEERIAAEVARVLAERGIR